MIRSFKHLGLKGCLNAGYAHSEGRCEAWLTMDIGAISLFTRVVEWIYKAGRQIHGKFAGRMHEEFTALPVETADIPLLREKLKEYFGEDVPKLEAMIEWHRSDPRQLFKVVKSQRKRFTTVTKIVGAFKALRECQ